MTRKKIIIVLVVPFVMTVFTVQTMSQLPPRPQLRRGITGEEYIKQMKEWYDLRQQQQREKNWKFSEGCEAVRMEFRKRTLGLTKQQWKLIEPVYRKVESLACEGHLGVSRNVRQNHGVWSFHWYKFSEDNYFRKAKIQDEMTDVEKIADELIDLLENEDAADKEIRQKIDALKQAKEMALKELPKAREELRSLLTPRQQAIMLLWGKLD